MSTAIGKNVRFVMIHCNCLDPHDEIQSRVALDRATVADYAAAFKAGDKFPPLDVFSDDEDMWIGDGRHRLAGAIEANIEEIECRIQDGGRRDAILFSVGANSKHGLRRSQADKAKAIRMLLGDPEWSKWSNSEIGRRCKVDHKTVAAQRLQPILGNTPVTEPHLGNSQDSSTRKVERNGTTYDMKVANIGRKPEPEADPGESFGQDSDADGQFDASPDPVASAEVPDQLNGLAPRQVEVAGDDAWLAGMAKLRPRLSEWCRERFDRDALLWRKVTTSAEAQALRKLVRREIDPKRGGFDGLYRRRLGGLLRVQHPDQWLICHRCEGGGRVDEANLECSTCGGNGYQVA